MALIACPTCTKKISETADNCWNCGYRRTLSSKGLSIGYFFGVIIFLGLLSFLLHVLDAFLDNVKTTAPTPESLAKNWEVVRTQRMKQLVVVDKEKETNEQTYRDAIQALCRPARFCFIFFWSDRHQVPSSWPMTDAQARAKTAKFARNPFTGFEQFLWACRIKADSKICFN